MSQMIDKSELHHVMKKFFDFYKNSEILSKKVVLGLRFLEKHNPKQTLNIFIWLLV